MTEFTTTNHPVATTLTLPGTQIHLLNESIIRGRIKFALFDFDGTLSLIREGWPEVMIPMMVRILKNLNLTNETEEELDKVVRTFVERLTGKQTIYQCIALCDAIRERGGTPEDPLVYKHQYLDLLWERIKSRVEGLREGRYKNTDYLVPGSLELLDNLKSHQVKMYLASGTDEPYVLDEAELLGVTNYFDGIYGAKDDYKTFSKAKVIERIIQEHSLQGPELVGFGDGFVEIENVKAVGGIAVGVATDEKNCETFDPWKLNRLTHAGADLMIPNYLEQAPLLAYLFAESSS